MGRYRSQQRLGGVRETHTVVPVQLPQVQSTCDRSAQVLSKPVLYAEGVLPLSHPTIIMAHLAATLPGSACAFSRHGRSYVPSRPVTGARATVPLTPKIANAPCHVGSPVAQVRSALLVNNHASDCSYKALCVCTTNVFILITVLRLQISAEVHVCASMHTPHCKEYPCWSTGASVDAASSTPLPHLSLMHTTMAFTCCLRQMQQ